MVLEANIVKAIAYADLLDREKTGHMNQEQLYGAVIVATGDKDLASQMSAERGMARMRAGLPA